MPRMVPLNICSSIRLVSTNRFSAFKQTYKEKDLEEDEQNANDLIHGVEIGDAQTSTTVPDIHMFQFAGRPSSGGRSGGADRSGHAVRACHRLDLRLGGVSRLSGGYATAVLQQVELILGQ